MSLYHALVLGITQGLSEFLPISSSGHLALVPWAFGWNDFGHDETLHKAFDVALHMGTLLAVIAYFWRDLLVLTREGLKMLVPRNRIAAAPEGRLAWLLVVATIPAAITGALLNDTVKKLDDEFWLIAVMLIVMGVVLLWADSRPSRRNQDEFRMRDALLMGVGQAAALQPGVSRSGTTISVARVLGFRRDAAARLSFLMAVPVTAAAGVYEAYDVFSGSGIPEGMRSAFLVGFVASAITGYIAVWGTIRYVRTHSFTPFVIYRLVIGFATLGLLASNVR